MEDDGTVTGFVPRGATPRGTPHGVYHFIGVQVVQADAFRQLPAGEPASSIGGVYDQLLAARRGSVRGFVSDAAFWDIGTPEDYAQTSAEFEERKGAGLVDAGRDEDPEPSMTMTDQRSPDGSAVRDRLDRYLAEPGAVPPAGSCR